MIKAVSFDIGGTLIQFPKGYSLKQTLLQTCGMDPYQLNKAYREHFMEKKNSLHDFCEQMQCGDPTKIEKIVMKYYAEKPLGVLYPGIAQVLSELKHRGCFLMVVSNKSYQNPSYLKHYGLGRYFDAEIYSYQVGCAKPGQEIFQAAQRIADVEPSEIIHVGNSIKSDILGAKTANWRSVFIQWYSALQEDVSFVREPDYVIENLEQLFPIIDYYK